MADQNSTDRSTATGEQRQLLADNVRRFRLEKGWSQKKLARHAQIDRTHLARLESRAINVSLDIIICLATALNIDIRELFTPREEWPDSD